MSSVGYAERLTPSWWLWAAAVGLGLGLGLILVPIGLTAAATVFLGSCLVFVALLARSTPTVGVDGSTVVAAKARIPVELIGSVDVLDAAEMRRAHGPGLDARAFLCLRGWIPTGVRLHLVDPDDPTPYWVVSSRSPQAFARAVETARGEASAAPAAGPLPTHGSSPDEQAD